MHGSCTCCDSHAEAVRLMMTSPADRLAWNRRVGGEDRRVRGGQQEGGAEEEKG